MAQTRILILLFISSILVVADQAAAAARKQLSPDAEEAIGQINLELQKAIDAVMSAAPPAKHKETKDAVGKHVQIIISALGKAKESGDEKQILRLFVTVGIANKMINRAPPNKRLRIMEDQFNTVAAPSELDCPTVDKAFCDMHAKMKKAVDGVIAAAAPADLKKTDELQATILDKIVYPASSTINKAYADGDEKKIAQVLAAYSKASDEVIAAAPADKFKVMKKTFAAATPAGN